MITRRCLFGFLVLLAGLTCGYIASIGAHRLHEKAHSALPDPLAMKDMPEASLANLSTAYERSKENFQEVLSQGQEAIREAARRRNLLLQAQDRVTENHEAYKQLILQSEREVDVLRLKDYYSQFYIHYFRWLDSGNEQSAVQYKLALGQFKATLDYIEEKYAEQPALTVHQLETLRHLVRITEQTNRSIRWARFVVVVLIFLLVMGIPRFIRDRAFKKFAASLYFDALFRPHMVSGLNSWFGLQRMALVLPVLYVLTLFIYSSFISWKIPLVLGLLGLLPVFMLGLLSRHGGRLPALMVSFMAPKMLLLILLLGFAALRGPNFFWHRIWGEELLRGLFISLFLMLIFRKFHVNIILARKWSHRNRSGSASMVWMALGVQVLMAGTGMYLFGPEDCLLALNRELLLLPPYLLGFPPVLLRWSMILAGVLTATALLVFILNRRPLIPPSSSTLS